MTESNTEEEFNETEELAPTDEANLEETHPPKESPYSGDEDIVQEDFSEVEDA